MSMTLAIAGGSPVRTTPFPAWPHFAPDEVGAAVRVLASGKPNYWGGEEGRQFEREFAAFVGCEYGVAVANGTVALELGLRALGIGPGDEVIVTPRTFIASASAVVMVGGRPVFADVDRDSQNLTLAGVRAALTERTRAIIAVHLAGWPCPLAELRALADERGLFLIEDCAQAHGARYADKPVGAWGDVAAFSFCQDKIMSTGGEGGLLTTNDPGLFDFAWSFKDHGKGYDAVYNREHPPGFRWLHERFGTNWRLTEMQSAMGRVLLRKLPGWVARRRELAARLSEHLAPLGALRLTPPPPEVYHSYYKYYAFVRPERLREGWDRDRLMAAVAAEGVPCLSGSCSEIYREQAFDGDLRPPRRLPVARELGETSLMFLVHPTLTGEDIDDVGRAVTKVLEVAGR